MHGGHIEREHAKPMEGGYYTDFDPESKTLEVTPAEDTNPVRTQHVLIATVKDAEGNPLDSRRVEWMILDHSVGSIVEVDESGWYDTRGYKVDNKYAVSHTNRDAHVLTRGNDDPEDDIHLGPGQTWCVITSATQGTTHVVAYAPGIHNWEKHKVFVVKHWNDAKWQWPKAATNPIGTDHPMEVKVMRHSDGKPIENWPVRFTVASGPDANWKENGEDQITVKTNSDGIARATLVQEEPTEGTNRINMEIVQPADAGPTQQTMTIARGETTKTWVGPKVNISKTGPSRAMVGDTITYNIVVNNPGRADATNVIVTDTLPNGFDFVSSSPQAKRNGRKLTWNAGRLAKGARETMSVKVKATQTGEFINPAMVKADNGLSDEAQAKTIVTAPKLAIEKSGPSEVLICEPIEYTVTVTNNGSGDAQNVKVQDDLPDGLETENGKGKIVVNAGTLRAGQSKKASYTVNATRAGKFTNTAVATGDRGLKAQAKHTVTVREPKLELTKTGPDRRFVNRNVEYTITAKNTGDGDCLNTKLVDTIPSGMSFVSASNGGTASGSKVTWDLGTIQPGQQKQVTLTLRAERIGTMVNKVDGTAKCTSDSAQAETEVTGIAAVLLEVVDEADPIEIGDNETYTIIVKNQGTAVGNNVRITATIPAEQQYVSSDGPTQAEVQGNKVTFAPLPQLAPKQTATYKVVVKAMRPGDVLFSVRLKTDAMANPATEEEPTHLYE